jgi:aspartate/methionine/tyrosine aminotransferase
MPFHMVGPVVDLIINSVSCTTTFIQNACIERLTGPQDSIREMMEEFRSGATCWWKGSTQSPA